MTSAHSILLPKLWGGQSWLPPAFSRRGDGDIARKSRLKGGCRQDCLPHQLLNLDEVLNK
jgi:hypothetical protein